MCLCECLCPSCVSILYMSVSVYVSECAVFPLAVLGGDAPGFLQLLLSLPSPSPRAHLCWSRALSLGRSESREISLSG